MVKPQSPHRIVYKKEKKPKAPNTKAAQVNYSLNQGYTDGPFSQTALICWFWSYFEIWKIEILLKFDFRRENRKRRLLKMTILLIMGVLVSRISLKFGDRLENQRSKLKKNKEHSGNNISKKNELMGESFFLFFAFSEKKIF